MKKLSRDSHILVNLYRCNRIQLTICNHEFTFIATSPPHLRGSRLEFRSTPPLEALSAPSSALGTALVALDSSGTCIVTMLEDRRDECGIQGDGSGIGTTGADVFERVVAKKKWSVDKSGENMKRTRIGEMISNFDTERCEGAYLWRRHSLPGRTHVQRFCRCYSQPNLSLLWHWTIKRWMVSKSSININRRRGGIQNRNEECDVRTMRKEKGRSSERRETHPRAAPPAPSLTSSHVSPAASLTFLTTSPVPLANSLCALPASAAAAPPVEEGGTTASWILL